MRKFTVLLALLFIGLQVSLAQDRMISGKVTSSEDGKPIPGATILVKGTTIGMTADLDGTYKLLVPKDAATLVFSFVGMKSKEVNIGSSNVINVQLEPDILDIEGVVVTALGISREKKSLGYATQEIDGDEINQVKGRSLISTMSGRASGVQIKSVGNMGGSTNIIIRGSSSITGNNQALIVIDGVPVNNDNTNNTGQLSGRHGYDYGNAASDIDPNDVASVNVLKGAAATALYGSRAANGAIVITTKKGKKRTGKGNSFGVSITSNVTTGFIDKSTFPAYQTNYGAGYGPYYGAEPYTGLADYWDVDGDGTNDLAVPTGEDASFGQRFDPNLNVYHYNSFFPNSPYYLQKRPWVAAENGPIEFFETPWSYTNSFDISGGGNYTTFRLGYTNNTQTGIMPNSRLDKDNLTFSGSYDVTDKLVVSASANYINTKGKGRNSTGYSDNIISGFRQWFQMNVDLAEQKELYDMTGQNLTWNPASPSNLAPAYWDNPYWLRYRNFETDKRDRLLAYAQVDYKLSDAFSLMGRYSIDTYTELQEERKAIGSASGEFGVGRPDVTSGYSRFDKKFEETNLDMILKYYNQLSENLNLNALIGTNVRRTRLDRVYASTDGGLIVPDLYSLGNSINPMRAPEEALEEIGVNGIFASASFGFKDFLFLDATVRRDESSTLPESDNTYYYPSVSSSFLFSNLMKEDWLDLGKFRIGYAEVGNDAPFASIRDSYTQYTTFAGTALFSLSSDKNNENLKPERTKSLETGLEMIFFDSKLGFDIALYKNNTVDQIMPVAISYATGFSGKYVNAGEIENKGIEISVFSKPVQTDKFVWTTNLNWAKNVNEVVSLQGDLKNLQIASLQGGVTINARVGEPYGTIQGTNFVTLDNQRLVDDNGFYQQTSSSDEVIGNINPDWNLGWFNKMTYKNWDLSFLIDWKMGGDVFSLDLWYGMATGLYEETDFTNDLGNPVRNTLEDGGGRILEGVKEDGSENDIRIRGDRYYEWGYANNPNALFIYDASYVKLREVVLTYNLPRTMIQKYNWLQGASVSVVGSNLWIIHKNLPHADPEASQSSGNVQGWQSGVMPTTRNIGVTLNVQF